MGSKWPEFRLDEITTLIIDCPHSTPEWTDSGVIVLRSNNIRNGSLDLTNPSFTTEEGYLDRIKRAIPTADDIVLTREAPMGEVCIIPKGLKCCLGQRMVLIRADKTQVIPEYLLYAIQSSYIQNQISWNEGTGTTVSNIRIPNIKALKIPLPSLNIQRGIVSNLLSVDKKISLNIATNQTLEQMSQTLFKSWFVDFDPVIDNALDAGNPIPEALQSRAELRQKVRNSADFKPLPADIRALFPAEFEETESGHLPAKWIFSDLSKLIDIKHGYAFKGEYFSDKATNDILLTPGNVRIGGGFKFDKFKYYDGEVPKDYIFEKDDIFVSMTDLSKECDSLGYAARIPYQEDVRFLHNQRLGRVIIGKHASSAKEFIYQVLVSQDYRNTVLGSVTGTTVKHTSPSKILSHVIPHSRNGEVEKKFDSICSSYSLSISKNNENNRILLQLRDTLLPKLISGELSLEDLPDLVTQTEPA
ncbi:restriction endonuclease subunit S [Klebsiella quasipneumoniae]|uniref:restriction endonuclease subunit S n=1 Tax=Klebsiella quasipneumoniae TaxID=1463165 RepID=UPI00384BABEF